MGDIDKIQQNALMDRYVLQVWNILHTLVLSCVLQRGVPFIWTLLIVCGLPCGTGHGYERCRNQVS